MRKAGLILDDHILYTILSDVLPTEEEAEARNLPSLDSIDRE